MTTHVAVQDCEMIVNLRVARSERPRLHEKRLQFSESTRVNVLDGNGA